MSEPTQSRSPKTGSAGASPSRGAALNMPNRSPNTGSAGASPSHGAALNMPNRSPKTGSAGASPSQLPDRSRPVHGVRVETEKPTIVFVTVCTKDRKPWLANVQVHEMLVSVWRKADAWLPGRYVIMPDHIHLFASPGRIDLPVENWVRFWKSQFTKHFGHPDRKWQSDFWDRRLRSDESYDEKWTYVQTNPVRHGLVDRAEAWPYQGELNELRW